MALEEKLIADGALWEGRANLGKTEQAGDMELTLLSCNNGIDRACYSAYKLTYHGKDFFVKRDTAERADEIVCEAFNADTRLRLKATWSLLVLEEEKEILSGETWQATWWIEPQSEYAISEIQYECGNDYMLWRSIVARPNKGPVKTIPYTEEALSALQRAEGLDPKIMENLWVWKTLIAGYLPSSRVPDKVQREWEQKLEERKARNRP